MKQTNKLDNLIKRILKEEMEKSQKENPEKKFLIYDENLKKTVGKGFENEEDAKKAIDALIEMHPELSQRLSISDAGEIDENKTTVFVSKKDPFRNQKVKDAMSRGKTVELVDPTDTVQVEEGDGHGPVKLGKGQLRHLPQSGGNGIAEEEKTNPEVKPTPTSHDLLGKHAEIVEDLEAIEANPKDAKHKRHANKALSYMGKVKTALEALSGHEKVLEDKQAQVDDKEADKHLKTIEKHVGKVIKDPRHVKNVMKHLSKEKAVYLKNKMNGQMDEEKIAHALIRKAIHEGAIPGKKKSSLKEEVTPEGIEKKAKEIQKPFIDGGLDNDFYNLLKNLEKHGENASDFDNDDAKQIYMNHYEGYNYKNMIDLVKKLHKMGKVSEYFIEDYVEEFPGLEDKSNLKEEPRFAQDAHRGGGMAISR